MELSMVSLLLLVVHAPLATEGDPGGSPPPTSTPDAPTIPTTTTTTTPPPPTIPTTTTTTTTTTTPAPTTTTTTPPPGDSCIDESLAECYPLPPVLYGAFALKRGPFGEYLELICCSGFFPFPELSLQCVNGTWCGLDGEFFNGSFPVCRGNTYGREFLAVFPRATTKTGNTEFYQLTFTTDFTATVSIQSEFNTVDDSVVVWDASVQDYDSSFVLTNNFAITNKVLHITSETLIDVNVVGYRLAGGQAGMYSYMAIPISFLETTYYLMTTGLSDQVAIVATECNTQVTIIRDDGNIYTQLVLQKYQVYTFFQTGASSTDFLGWKVVATAKVAVYSGFIFAYYPNGPVGSRDSGIEQLIGVSQFYQLCIMGPFFPDEEYGFTIVASEDGTAISITTGGSGTTYSDLDESESSENLVTTGEAVVVEADKPILVGQFSLQSTATGRAPGDPTMVLCLDPSKYSNYYKFKVTDNFDDYYLRVVILNGYEGQLLLNGAPFVSVHSVTVTVSDGQTYIVLYTPVVATALYELYTACGQTFGASTYGFRRVGQYGRNLGQIYPLDGV